MLGWALTFLTVALVAGAHGFTGVVGTTAGIAQILLFVFLGASIALLLLGRRAPGAAGSTRPESRRGTPAVFRDVRPERTPAATPDQ